jgi:hypothetical protein
VLHADGARLGETTKSSPLTTDDLVRAPRVNTKLKWTAATAPSALPRFTR